VLRERSVYPALNNTEIENLHVSVANMYKYCIINVYDIRVGQEKDGDQEPRRRKYMRKKLLAKTTDEFDKRFDAGEDVSDLIDLSKAKIARSSKKIRVTLDIAESLVRDIDAIRERIGVDRGALIKIWLHEKVMKEKSSY